MTSYISALNDFEIVYGETPFTAWQWPIFGCLGYVLMVIIGPQLMKGRQPITIRPLVFIHNWFLSLLSLVMVVGVISDAFLTFGGSGYSVSEFICDEKRLTLKGGVRFWLYIFYLSKYYEFLDTLLQIFRKRQLIFLHCYHHIATVIIVYWAVLDELSIQWMAVVTNGVVHVIMYAYYGLVTIDIRPSWKKYVTRLQIYQFFIDIGVPFYWVILRLSGWPCPGTYKLYVFGEIVVVSFLLLFVKFYRDEYTKHRQVNDSKKKDH